MRRSIVSTLVASALVTASFIGSVPLVAEAALVSGGAVQRGGDGLVVANVSADGRYAVTGRIGTNRRYGRLDLISGAFIVLPYDVLTPRLTASGSSVYFDSTNVTNTAGVQNPRKLYRYTFASKVLSPLTFSNSPSGWSMKFRDMSSDALRLAFIGTNSALGTSEIWLYDVTSDEWRRPDAAIPTPAGVRRKSTQVSLSGDGRVAAITSYAGAGAPGQVWAYDWVAKSAKLVSAKPNGAAPTGCSSATPDVNTDGTLVSFRSTCAGLVAGQTTAKVRVFVRNRVTASTKFITDRETTTVVPDPASGGAYSGPQFGQNGQLLSVLENRATRLGGVPGSAPQPVVYRVSTLENVMLAKPSGGALPNGLSRNVFLSSATKRAVFTSRATNFAVLMASTTTNLDRTFVSGVL